jgi:hypothetical protein
MTHPNEQAVRNVAERHMDVCIICGPGCCAPVLGVHTSCPGPAAGAEVVSPTPARRRELLRELQNQAIDAGLYGEPAPEMRPVSVESPGNDGFRFEAPGGES